VGCGRTRRERLFFSLSSHGFDLLDSTATPAPLSHDPNCVDLRITALSPGKIDPSFQIRAPPNPISTEHPHGLTSSPSSVSCHPRVAHLLL
jgi:hypothetical protein